MHNSTQGLSGRIGIQLNSVKTPYEILGVCTSFTEYRKLAWQSRNRNLAFYGQAVGRGKLGKCKWAVANLAIKIWGGGG